MDRRVAAWKTWGTVVGQTGAESAMCSPGAVTGHRDRRIQPAGYIHHAFRAIHARLAPDSGSQRRSRAARRSRL